MRRIFRRRSSWARRGARASSPRRKPSLRFLKSRHARSNRLLSVMALHKRSPWRKWSNGFCVCLRRRTPMLPMRSRWPWPTRKPPRVTASIHPSACEIPEDMITFLRGKLAEALPTQIVVDVGGVGYELLIPLSSFDKLPARGHDITILTHLSIREDAHVLYGFMSSAERDMFRLLVSAVSGIGPKTALNILSGINITALRSAVATGDVKSLSQISGVGKKTAERIVVELKDKLGKAIALEPGGSPRAALSADDQKFNDA